MTVDDGSCLKKKKKKTTVCVCSLLSGGIHTVALLQIVLTTIGTLSQESRFENRRLNVAHMKPNLFKMLSC